MVENIFSGKIFMAVNCDRYLAALKILRVAIF